MSSYMTYFSSFGAVEVAKSSGYETSTSFYLRVGRLTLNCKNYEQVLKIIQCLRVINGKGRPYSLLINISIFKHKCVSSQWQSYITVLRKHTQDSEQHPEIRESY